MTKEQLAAQEREIYELRKQCSFLERKIARLREQQIRQENIDDINRRILKHTNERLLQYHQQAQRENICKSDFLANMSHEIRTPLNIILGMANLLADTNLDTTQSQYLNSLRVTGRQLTEIINNVLEFSRIDAGKIRFEPEPFSLEKIIQQLEASIVPLCIQKKLEYTVSCSPKLIMERTGDALKIYQVLLNLINNAVKFTATGGISLSIDEDSTIPGNLVLSVKDSGIGISLEHQKIIFERFTQVHDIFSNPQSGTGLGLAISHKLTLAMGGDLKVESQPGRGSVFICSLPLPPVTAADRNLVQLEALDIMPEDFRQLHILAVDDVKENIEVIRVYLKDYPISIDAAGNGEEALAALTKNHFDLMLMDIRMPIMDGISATKEIRNREKQGLLRQQTILAITAHAFQEQKKKILQAGFDGVLCKPFFKTDLIRTIYRFALGDKTACPPPQLDNKALGLCLENNKPEPLPEALKEMLPTLTETITHDLKSMQMALEKRDYESLYASAHGLSGVAGMFGLQKMGDLIVELAQTVKAGNLTVAAELFKSLNHYLAGIKAKQSIPAGGGCAQVDAQAHSQNPFYK